MRTMFILLLLFSLSLAFTPKFRDATVPAGIDIAPDGVRKLLKYGGPTVADLDRDGFYDLIFVHHGSSSVEIYFNNGNGTFTKGDFFLKRDVHAIAPFLLPRIKTFFFTVVLGGNNGNLPNPPVSYRVFKNRTIIEYDDQLGLNIWTARGRGVIFMPLTKTGTQPDALYLNAEATPERCSGCTDGQFDAYAYTGQNPIYQPRILQNFNPREQNTRGLAIDPNGNGKLDLLTWRHLTLHKITNDFEAKDVTKRFLGEQAYQNGGMGVAEIDFDNDGDFDLYIARSKSGFINSTRGEVFPDLLLENRDGRFVNVAIEAGVPQDTISTGVTAGDFNNDGWMDLYVTVIRGVPDFLLLNNGDGTFSRIDIGIGKDGAEGDNALAVDYDNDGRVDIIRSEGSVGDLAFGGQFRILKNVPRNDDGIGRFVKVRVGWQGRQTSLHAVVVVTANGKRWIQRLGQAGVQTPHSYLEILHFGIGKAKNATVQVRWLNGVVGQKSVKAGETVRFGAFYKKVLSA